MIGFQNFLKVPELKADFGTFTGFQNPQYNKYLTSGNGSDAKPFELSTVSVTAKSTQNKTAIAPTVVENKLNTSNLLLFGLIGLGLIITSKA